MAKKSQSLFDTFISVKSVRQGESLRFRNSKGKLTKFDGRKKLVAEIWLGNKKTNRVLNKTRKGQPILQKFDARLTKKRILFLKASKAGPRKTSKVKTIRIKIDARYTIMDNIEAKCVDMINDIVKYSQQGSGAFVTAEFSVFDEDDNEELFQVLNLVLKGTRAFVILEIARAIIARMYKNKKRMSSIKDSPMARRGKYVRSLPIKFTWDETKSLKDM